MRQDKRQRRGAQLKFIGSFQHWAFGVMDDDDRVAMENNMRNLLANQHDLKELITKQTSVVESTVNLLKRTTNEINSQFTDIKCKIGNISATMNENYFVYRESIRFFIISKEIHELIDECDEMQKEMINVLLDVNNGQVHPMLLSPSQLQSKILKIRNVLPEKSTGTELKKVFHLMKGHGMFVDTQLVIDLKILLFNRQSSHFYRVIPIPFEQNGLLSDEFVCEENFPWRDASTNNCELAPLRPHINLKCNYDEVESSPYWIQMKQNGNLLFRIFANATAHIKCSDNQQAIMELPPQGILSLEADCTARIDEITLVAVHHQRNEIRSQFRSMLLKEVNPAEKGIIKPLGNVVINHHEEINQLKKVVDHLKKENIELRGLRFHHWSGHLAFILVILVLLILIGLFIRRMIKKRLIAAIQYPGGATV
ncbi:uncharacterized protein LOC142239782 [Haematobia irritans]|uniref:uncharacterized protein LOC142239782 n=1 Tax=Haematobia irritans TaxID=7368 RepID=UPI003F5086CB